MATCRSCARELDDDPLWQSPTLACPDCGTIAPAAPDPEMVAFLQQQRVQALSRQAGRELAIFLGVVIAVACVCWAAMQFSNRLPRWRLWRDRHFHAGAIRREGADYYIRNVGMPRGDGPLPVSLDRFAVRGLEDIDRVYRAFSGSPCEPVLFAPFSDAVHVPAACRIAAVVNVSHMPYHLQLISFGQSNSRVLKLLRDELRIPPPSGHAVIRIFEDDDPIPEPLRSFHTASPEIAGAAFGGPYVAVFDADAGLEATIDHELVHAYLSTAMHGRGAALPSWFHEGTALSLANTPLVSSGSGEDGLRFRTLTAQYQQYKRVFDRVGTKLGRARFLAVLRACVESASERPLLDATGSKDYAGVLAFADRWMVADTLPYVWVLTAGVAIGVANWLRRRSKAAPKPAL